MKILLFACGVTGYLTFKQLVERNENVELVFTNKSSEDIITFAKENNIGFITEKPKIEHLRDKEFCIGLSINYKFILNEEIFSFPKEGTYNIHASLLPAYRGRCPNVWAIINGERETGITIHKIDSGVDTGDIAIQEKINLDNEITGSDLIEYYKEKYPALIKDFLDDFKKGEIKLKKQKLENVSYYDKRVPEDGIIDWNKSSAEIYNWIRAQTKPYYPGAYSFIKNNKFVIWKAKIISETEKHKNVGEIIINENKKIEVLCGIGRLLLLDYESDYKIQKGDKFENINHSCSS